MLPVSPPLSPCQQCRALSFAHFSPLPFPPKQAISCSFPAVNMLVQISTEEIRGMEREEAWQPTKGVPVVDEDITEVGASKHPSSQ